MPVTADERGLFIRIKDKIIETRSYSHLSAVLCFIFFLGLFLALSDPSLGNRDQAAFQFAFSRPAVTHPPGYPIFLMLGSFFAFIMPFADYACRANWVSAIFGASALALFIQIARSKLNFPASITITTAVWGITPLFLLASTKAEVYSFHLLILGLGFWIGISLLEQVTPKRICAAAFVTGLAFAHHLTGLALIFGFLFAAACGWKSRSGRIRVRTILIGLIPITAYFYTLAVLFRTGEANPLSKLVNLIAGTQYSQMVFMFPVSRWDDRFLLVLKILMKNFHPIVLIIASFGLYVWARRSWRTLLVVWGTLLPIALFAWGYGIADIDFFLLPLFVGVGVAAGFMLKETRSFLPGRVKYPNLLMTCVLLAFVLSQALYATSAESGTPPREETLNRYFSFPEKSRILFQPEWDSYWAIRSLREIEKYRDDLQFIELEKAQRRLDSDDDIFCIPNDGTLPVGASWELVSYDNPIGDFIRFLSGIKDDSLVVLVEKNEFRRVISPELAKRFRRIGSTGRFNKASEKACHVVIGRPGLRRGAAFERFVSNNESFFFPKGTPIGETGVSLSEDLRIRSGAFDMGNEALIYIGRRLVSLNGRGYNAIVIDSSNGFVRDRANFDTYRPLTNEVYRIAE